MSTIRDTITSSMNNLGMGQYLGDAEPVIKDLEAREAEAVGRLVTFAQSKGLSGSEATNAVNDAGFTIPVPEPIVDEITQDQRDGLTSVRHELGELMQKIDNLLS